MSIKYKHQSGKQKKILINSFLWTFLFSFQFFINTIVKTKVMLIINKVNFQQDCTNKIYSVSTYVQYWVIKTLAVNCDVLFVHNGTWGIPSYRHWWLLSISLWTILYINHCLKTLFPSLSCFILWKKVHLCYKQTN